MLIKIENYQIWRVIEIGDYAITSTNSNNEIVPKLTSDYEKEDFENLEINVLAVKLLHYDLGAYENNQIMGYKMLTQFGTCCK